MSNNRMVVDHLKAALLATNADKTFLAYLIQMALIECATAPQVFGSTPTMNECRVSPPMISPVRP
ncbi:hypothetical protein RvVAR0630_pl03140 (plasmid) [Agrobacterium vitis]|nr:hypothetical protein RvVAR0630_pl03140 [Agrobacterium vitis]